MTRMSGSARQPNFARRSSPHQRRHPCRMVLPLLLCLAFLLPAGCRAPRVWKKTAGNEVRELTSISRQIDHPQVPILPAAWASEPVTVKDRDRLEKIQYRDVSLRDVLNIAMQNSEVLRDLGGVVLRNPDITPSQYVAALRETDPRYSMEAALSAFDAQLAATAYFNNKDQTFNNPFFSGGTNTFQQDLNDYMVELSKRTATGSRLALRGVNTYDSNNAPSNTFPSAWYSYVECEIRQPFLHGGVLEFNRIA
ncbi:MAG: hypothetical protein ACK58L_22160, partial [Planctomycetota bacterium]